MCKGGCRLRLGDCNLHELFCLREGQRTVDYNPSVTSLRTGDTSPCTGEAFPRGGTRAGKYSRAQNLLLNIRVCGTGGRSSSDADGGSLCRPSWRADHVAPVKQNRFLPKKVRSRQFSNFCSARKPQCRRLPRGTGGWREQVDGSARHLLRCIPRRSFGFFSIA